MRGRLKERFGNIVDAIRGTLIPGHGCFDILGHALALLIDDANGCLRPVITGFGEEKRKR